MTDEVKHTPGPWIEGLDESGVVVVTRDTARVVARLGPIWEQTEETMANAQMMAAAPALADRVAARLGECRRLSGCGSPEWFGECELCHADRLALCAAGRLSAGSPRRERG